VVEGSVVEWLMWLKIVVVMLIRVEVKVEGGDEE